MNKFVFCVCFFTAVLGGCASQPAVAAHLEGSASVTAPIRGQDTDDDAELTMDAAADEGLSLDAAIREAAGQMDRRLPASTKVALINVGSASTALSEYILGRLEAALVGSGKLVVVDRANLDKIRAEQGFQLSGDVSDESAKAIGQLLGAGAIVTGSFSDLGDVYGLTLKAINMETAAVAVSYPADIAKSTRITTLLAAGGGATGSGAGDAAVAKPAAERNAAPAATKVYKVGETGPAGGIVFHDKGNDSGGWRYLEAAPVSTERNLIWGLFGTTVNGTGVELGVGKQNTMAIVQSLMSSGEFNSAVYYCDALESGGYNDWYLPSKGELAMMYINLKQKGLGGFSGDWYWSSSDVNNDAAWKQQFSDGSQYVGNNRGTSKSDSHRVRAIRQF
jgi:hypothetical protein